MLFNNLVDHAQTETSPGSLRVHEIKWLENAGMKFPRYADALIADKDGSLRDTHVTV